jgi:Na+-translocating ferredoxin:NAD+ oxidoreductase RnfD subunit
MRRDPRHYQIAVLASLALYGILALDLEIEPAIAATILATALASQYLLGRRMELRFDPRSALISGLSLCLLLRTTSAVAAASAALVAVASKFLLRRKGKHVFNPSALGLVVVVLLTDVAWVSPGQWGSVALFAFLAAGLGMLVVHRAARSDVTLAFLAAWCALVFARACWLGDPLPIPLHQLRSGSLLLFSFYMISDPKTTPDSRAGRILFGCLVAAGGALVQFGLYRGSAPLWALVALSPLVPLIDRVLPSERYRWDHPRPAGSGPGRSLRPRSLLRPLPELIAWPVRADERSTR